MSETAAPVCYRHPGRPASLPCAHCGRPLCVDCARPSDHGWRCDTCAARGALPVAGAGPPSAPGARHPEGGDPSPGTPRRPRRVGAGRLGATNASPTVIALIAVNVVIYLLSRANPPAAFARYGMVPVEVHHGQWYRLVTAAFLHVNTEHILFNMVTLLIIGSPVEVLLGRARFLAVYLLAGLGGSVCSYLLSRPTIEGVGASGAIFGLFGAYAVLARRHRFDTRTVLVLIVIQLGISFLDPGIDWRAHIGGLVVGAAATWGFVLADGSPRVRTVVGQGATVAVCLAALAALLALPPGHVNL